MSTKTTFKRIALVAVAALGLGVLSVAPSSAAVIGLTATSANGTATTAVSDSSTAATLSVRFFAQTAAADTATVVFAADSIPTGAVTTRLRMSVLDTATATSITSVSGLAEDATDSATATTAVTVSAGTDNTYAAANFAVFMDGVAGIKAGTYALTAIVTPYSNGAAGTATTKSVSIVVSTAVSLSTVASAVTSTLTDPSVSTALATVSSTNAARATMTLTLLNAAGNAASESVTATITGPGTIGAGSVVGKSVVLAYSGATTLNVYSDGTAGVSTITVSTTSVTFGTKSISFYSKSPKTITASVNNPVLNVGANDKAVKATAVDANGTAWTGQLYIVASTAADALVGGSATAPKACTYNSTYKVHYCPVTTLTPGTASFKVVDQSLALGTETAYAAAMTAASSDAVSLTVSGAALASVKLAFDKASYAPFEKAYITVTPLDAAGKTLGTRAITDLFAAGGISANQALGNGSDTLTAVTLTTSADSSATAPRTAGSYTYTVYMPAQGTVTISATGGTGLPVAGQVAVTASADIVNASVDAATDAANEATDAANAATDAALAAADAADAATAAAQDASDAVAALSATVAKLVASLKAQITSLTNLVIKIQKKVKA